MRDRGRTRAASGPDDDGNRVVETAGCPPPKGITVSGLRLAELAASQISIRKRTDVRRDSGPTNDSPTFTHLLKLIGQGLYMVTPQGVLLAWATGATDYEILGDAHEDPDMEQDILIKARVLLERRGDRAAAQLLSATPFRLLAGRNHFGDDFSVLSASLPLNDYDTRVRRQKEIEIPARALREVLVELGEPVRVVAIVPESKIAEWSPAGYECELPYFRQGGWARIYRTTRLEDGQTVILKKVIPGSGEEGKARLRREIQEQSRLIHPHVMPIFDHDPNYTWFVMPLADGTLAELRETLSETEIVDLTCRLAEALAEAHRAGLTHRDLSPSNILRVPFSDGVRWVVADWGFVRRPRGHTTAVRTVSGTWGTEGFVAPEAATRGHDATDCSDVYSLGRVFGYALTGKSPEPNVPQRLEGKWRSFVQRATHPDPARRIATMADFLSQLQINVGRAESAIPPPPSPRELFEKLKIHQIDVLESFVDLVLQHPDNDEIWLDLVGELPREVIIRFVKTRARDAEFAVERIGHHLCVSWGDRDFNWANVPLQRLFWFAEAARIGQSWGLFEDSVHALFEAEVCRRRYSQREVTCKWLTTLRDEAARIVERVLLDSHGAIDWYRANSHWSPLNADPSIRRAFSDM